MHATNDPLVRSLVGPTESRDRVLGVWPADLLRAGAFGVARPIAGVDSVPPSAKEASVELSHARRAGAYDATDRKQEVISVEQAFL